MEVDAPRSHREWRDQVLMRDGYTCRWCGETERLHAHHIARRKDHPDLALEVSNGITLCAECHAQEHEGDLPLALVHALRGESGLSRTRKRKVKTHRSASCPDFESLNFNDLLSRSGLKRGDLAHRLGVLPSTVSRWNQNAPGYALAYLELYVSIRESL